MRRTRPHALRRSQGGAALIIVLVILLVVELAGVAASQIVLLGERSARNQRDQEIAWQSAEAALQDAELDLINASGARLQTLQSGVTTMADDTGCGNNDATHGLCAVGHVSTPAWLLVDFETGDDNNASVAFGAISGRTFSGEGFGVRPARKPRYIIELVPDTSENPSSAFVYRITAMGFGPRADIQVVLQTVYRL